MHPILEYILENGGIEREQRYSIAFQLIGQASLTHSRGFIDQDRKPGNIFWDGNNAILFDLDGIVHIGYDGDYVSTAYYHSGDDWGTIAFDMYSLGVTLGEIFFGSGFKTATQTEMDYEELELPHSSLFDCLLWCSEKRPTADQLHKLITRERRSWEGVDIPELEEGLYRPFKMRSGNIIIRVQARDHVCTFETAEGVFQVSGIEDGLRIKANFYDQKATFL